MGNNRIGILAVQGGFDLHVECIQSLACSHRLVRNPEDLNNIDALIVPGGESTTMQWIMKKNGLFPAIKTALLNNSLPCFGTCAGLILAATTIYNDHEDSHNDEGFGYAPMCVTRNAYGTQVDSFETDLNIPHIQEKFRAVFIRAPRVLSHGKEIKVLARCEKDPVLLQYKRSLFTTFHPELSNSLAVHKYWLDLIGNR